MNQLQPAIPEDDEEEGYLFSETTPPSWQMKQLKPRHKSIASLLAQGGRNVDIAKIMNVTPQYIYMLSRQPLMKEYISQMCEVTGVRLEALFEKSVDVIAETLESGSEAGRLKAARLQLEVTGRVGARDAGPRSGGGADDRLLLLAERLLFLGSGKREPGVYYENGEKITDAEFSESGSGERPESS